ncbi:hypothetical protein D3C86_540020 [compost metagenome]
MRHVTSEYLRMLARRQYKADYLFRLVTQDGKTYPIPSRAVLNAPASATINATWTWEMPVSIMASMMPCGVEPEQYHGIEVDRVVAGNRLPYFRGLIDEVLRGWRKENGITVATIEMQAFGVMQRAKGYRVDSLRLNPVTQDGDMQMCGIGRWRTWQPGTPASAPYTEQIPYGGATLGDIFAFTDDTMATMYVEGSDYTVDRSTTPIKVNWIASPTSTRFIWYDALERFVVPYLSNAPRFITLPPGRDYHDLYHTYVLDFEVSPPRIRVADKTGYTIDLTTGDDDYLTVITGDGVEHLLERSGFSDVNGWIDMIDPLPSGIAKGDPVRLPTTEAISAWADDRYLSFARVSNPVNLTNVWNTRLFKPYPNLGIAVPTPRVWSPTDDVFVGSFFVDGNIGKGFGYIREDVDANRVEEVMKAILTTETGLFAPSEVITEPTGAYVKNRTWSGYDLAEVLKEGQDQALPPHGFIHDTQDGKVMIKPYRQKAKPDWVLGGIVDIKEVEVPEPFTAVTVIAESSDPVNLAGEWVHTVDGAASPSKITDGITSGNGASTEATDTEDGILIVFEIPRPEPSTIHPLISEIKVTATGQVTMFFSDDLVASNIWLLPGMNRQQIDSGTVTIGEDEIARVITANAGYLVVIITPVVKGDVMAGDVEINPTCSEIEILTKKAGYWRAALTDDTNLAPADQGPDKFGTIWRQPDPSKRLSYRYAPTSYLKRVQTLYASAKAREKVLSMTGISQQDTRDYAERWQDELLRAGKKYTVIAPYDDRAELGDTVHVAWEKFRKDLLLWGIQGPANPREVMATYTFHDYGL